MYPKRSYPGQYQQGAAEAQQRNFKELSASSLYCPSCKQAMPVREKMLLVLSSGDVYDYVCTACGSSLGTKTAG